MNYKVELVEISSLSVHPEIKKHGTKNEEAYKKLIPSIKEFGVLEPIKIIKEHKKIDKILNVTVDFIAEIITCIKDKDKKVISGDPEKIKKIYDTWVFSRDITSANPNWQLVNTLT